MPEAVAQEETVSTTLIQEQVVHLLVHKDTLFQLVAEEQVDLVTEKVKAE